MFQTKRVLKNQDASVHLFSDASETGYGQESYLQLVNEDNQIHYSLLIGKSRVTPTKYVSIPRLELTAATLSIKMLQLTKRELELNDVTSIREHVWIDSQVVLGYINNESKMFKPFVVNSVQLFRDNSNTNQLHYVGTKSDPADYVSRGSGCGQIQRRSRGGTMVQLSYGNLKNLGL